METIHQIITDILWLIACGIFWVLWDLLKNKVASARYDKVAAILRPIIVSTLAVPSVREDFKGMFAKDSPGGYLPTPTEIAGFARVVAHAARPQLQLVRGFAIDSLETEVEAHVRSFFVSIRSKAGVKPVVPSTTPLPLEDSPAVSE